MPRPGGRRVQEKSKDFFGSMKRLLGNLRTWKFLMILSLILAMASAIMALIMPDKLSTLADEIGLGLVPRTENIEKIYTAMGDSLSKEKLQTKMQQIMMSTSISNEEKNNFLKIMEDMQTNENDNQFAALTNCSEDILLILFDDIKVDGVSISKEDLVSMVMTMSTVQVDNSEQALEVMDNLPKSIYSLIEPKMNVDKIKKLAIFMGIIYLISALFSYIQSLSLITVSNSFAKSLRTSISTKINKLPLKFFDTHETGDILSRVTNDIDTIAQNLNNSLSTLVTSVTLFLGSIIMMFYTNWIMAITAILSSLLGFVFMFAILGKSQKYFSENQRALGELNGYIEENYSAHNVVKAYNGINDAVNDFDKLNDDLFQAKRKSIFLSGTMQPMMGFIGNLGYVAVCVVGALLTMNNIISFGVIVAFMIYVRLFTNPLSQIAQATTNLQSTAAASERVYAFLDEKEMPSQDDKRKHLDKSKVKGEIEFRNVKFGYEPGRTIIKNFSVTAKPGQKIAIVGPTGAGKTTMVNLLMKFYDINDGDILIDGVSSKDLTRENIHDLFVMVLQDTWLFEGTIGENLRFNKKDVTDEELWQACRTVGIDHFVKTLPGGLNSVITDDTSVSQGQKQLLTIARGMIEDAPFLILDEATSNVDTRTEELVQKAMDKLTEGRTSFIIAHRLSTIKNADLILVMNEGNIIEQGTHEELMAQGGFYEQLYNSQFEKTI